MSDLKTKLKPFVRRVRWMAAWRGLALGATVGGCLAVIWAVLDWTRVLYADWRGLGIVILGSALIGAIVGFLSKVPTESLAASIDIRAGLKDRLATAVESRPVQTSFDDAQSKDADRSLAGIEPARLYPVRFGRWQVISLVSLVLAASVFLLGNSPMMRGPKSEQERKELKEMGQKVERIARPLEKVANQPETPANQKRLTSDLTRLAKEMEQGKINKEEALRKVNDLADKAEKDSKTLAEETIKKTEKMETALGKYEKMKLDEAGISEDDLAKMNLTPEEQNSLDRMMEDKGIESPKSKFSDQELKEMGVTRTAEKLSQLTPEQREQLQQEVAKRQAELQKEMDRIDKMSPEERKQHEEQMKELQKQQQEMQKLSEALKLSEETKAALRELMQSEEMQKLREMMQEMREKSQQTQQGQPMSKEDIEQLKKQLEELAKGMKDPALKEQMMQQLRDAIKQMESGQMSSETMQMMMESMGMDMGGNSSDPNGSPSTGSDDQFADTGKIVKSEKEMETKGKTTATRVNGEWNDKTGEQWSVTVKAPTQVGNRSSVPYQKVMPKFKSAAERALSSGKIPREKEKRVKEYFDSLVGGKK